MTRLFYDRKGFSLIESAMVLAIAGLVVAVLWAIIHELNEGSKIKRANEIVLAVASKVQSIYAENPNMDDGDITDSLIAANVLPGDILATDPNTGAQFAFTPWGQTLPDGTQSRLTVVASASARTIGVVLNNIPARGCADLILLNANGRNPAVRAVASAATRTYTIGDGDNPETISRNSFTALNADSVKSFLDSNPTTTNVPLISGSMSINDPNAIPFISIGLNTLCPKGATTSPAFVFSVR